MEYTWDNELNLFRRAHVQPFAYSDGAEVEQRLFALIQSAGDKGTFSLELSEGINDWPSEYHLSRARHCLIRPLGIEPGERVLELGCGCGAITRYLGEIGAKVIAVEGSFERARIAAERCRDLPNVKVFVDDLLNFETVEQFDWILLVGVLEYAPAFTVEKEPVQHYLRSVKRFLAPHGKLVIAIENKLGLKYFNNCSEDHLGVPFVGIQNLYGNKTPRTFGRQELIGQLTAAGFLNAYFYYPFPDYKLPSVVISDDALFEPQFNAVDLIIRAHARDYTGSPYRLFDDALVYSALSENGLFSEMSNSFLVVAARTQAPLNSHKLAMSFSINRFPEFSVLTTFCRTDESISVTKEAIAPFLARTHYFHDGFDISNVLSRSNYHLGSQLLWRVLSVRANNGTLDQVVAALQPWFNYIIQYATSDLNLPIDNKDGMNNLKHFFVPGNFIDCTPFNIIETTQGLIYIDDEWQANCVVPLGWVVARSVLHSLRVGLATGDLTINTANVVQELCKSFGFSVTEADIAGWVEMEARFVSFVTGQALPDFVNSLSYLTSGLISLNQSSTERDRQIISLNQNMTERDGQIISLTHDIAERDEQITSLNQSIAKRDEEIAAILNSSSWRLTRPLRFLGDLLRQTLQRLLFLLRVVFFAPKRFDNEWYLEQNPDVAASGMDSFKHYILFGKAEGRKPAPDAPLLHSKKRRIYHLLKIAPQIVAQQGGILGALLVMFRIYRREGLAGIKYRINQQQSAPQQIVNFPRNESTFKLGLNSPANLEAINTIVTERWSFTCHAPTRDHLTANLVDFEPSTVDINVVTYNSSQWVAAFVESIIALDYPMSYITVYFVDNCSTDNTIETLKAASVKLLGAGCKVNVLPQQQNLGFGAGHNLAIKAGSAPYCLITNIDLTFEKNTLSRLMATALADLSDAAAWETRQKPYEHPKFYDPVTGSTNWNSHACVLLRRSAVELVGGYDETFFMYGEDVELSYRLRRAGYMLRYCPAAVVMHYCYEDAETLKPLQYTGSTFANLYIRLKYGTILDVFAVPIMAFRLASAKPVFHGSRWAVFCNLVKLTWFAPRALLSRCRSKAHFPFRSWDYEIIRDGAFVKVPPLSESMPLVSVITRTYRGREVFLRQALLSVAHQSYPEIEHIVVEDGGDTMREVVKGIADVTGREIKFIALNKVGRSAAGNAGLSASTGRWCMFLDDDDLLFGDHIEVLANKLYNDPGAVAAYSLAWEVVTDMVSSSEDGYREVEHRVPPSHRQEFDIAVLQKQNFMPIQSVLFDRSLFVERGGFDEDIDVLEDWLLWNRFAQGNHFTHVSKVTSLYRTPCDRESIRRRREMFDVAYQDVLARICSLNNRINNCPVKASIEAVPSS